MRKVNFNQALTLKLSPFQREVIERMSIEQETTLGEANRKILDEGLKAMGIGT